MLTAAEIEVLLGDPDELPMVLAEIEEYVAFHELVTVVLKILASKPEEADYTATILVGISVGWKLKGALGA